jgi:glycosyltransferase involved in cell wall biosynthesis
MAERAALLLLDPDRRRALGESGCRYLLEHFSWRRFVERLAGFYLKT